jgi:hypothetical protein
MTVLGCRSWPRNRGLGYDERRLQDWLAADPSRLGLGEVSVVDQEQGQAAGGLLDLLALDRGSDTYYSIEVQLGEIDASHGFRVFDYWARNRARVPGKTHVAVLMAESAGGRFRPALEALAETVPLIVIELRCWQGDGEALLIPEIVVANESLDLADTPAAASAEERTEADWRSAVSETMWAFKDAFVAWAATTLASLVSTTALGPTSESATGVGSGPRSGRGRTAPTSICPTRTARATSRRWRSSPSRLRCKTRG